MSDAHDAVGLQARLQPQRLAAVELVSSRNWTYAEFDRAIGQCAAVLQLRGSQVGDRIASLARNRVELVLLHLACARLGAIYVPLNWRLSSAEIERLLADADPRLLVGDTLLESVVAATPRVTLDELAAQIVDAEPLPAARIDEDRPSLILYTSGTSGNPKGVLLSERNLAQTASNFSLLGRVTHESTFLCDSPMFHIIGMVTNVRPALMQGGTILVSDGFDPARTLQRLADPELRVTHYFCVPQMAHMLRQQPGFDPAPLRRLTGFFTGGAPHPAANIRGWLADGISIVDGFGMSEAGTVFGMPIEREAIAAKAGSVGVATPGIEARIVDAHGDECAIGTPGELQLRGPNISAGYWRNPQETRAAFQDGWFRTGDIAKVDEEGFYFIVDRQKDMFISGGENVYPAEIEAVLAGMSGVAEVAVVGVADTRWGEVGHAAIVRRPDSAITADDVLIYLASRLARYKQPKQVSFLDALPRTGTGKVQKRMLKAVLART